MNDYDHPLSLQEKELVLLFVVFVFYIMWIFQATENKK